MTRCKLAIAFSIAGIFLALALPAVAQDDYNEKAQLAFRLGGGSGYVSDLEEWENGIGGGFTFLIPISKTLKILGDVNGMNLFSSEEPTPTRNIFCLAAGLDYAPGRQGFFAGASFLFGHLTYEYTYDGDRNQIQQSGPGFNVHTGYFFKLSDTLGLGPRLDYSYLYIGTEASNGYLNDNEIAPYWWILSLAVQFP